MEKLKSHEDYQEIIGETHATTKSWEERQWNSYYSLSERNIVKSMMSDCKKNIVLDVGTDLPPPSRTKVMEQSPLISENSGYETIQIYR